MLLSGFLISILTVAAGAFVPLHQQSLRRRTILGATVTSNNVVLRPSEHHEAFDSFKIGSARVHRYIRDDSTKGSSAEYVMWYHGRSKNFAEEKSLPPLSTGRIGRARSLNGLQWEKATEGSESEDASDVSLGLNQEAWWGFDTSHVGLGQVLLPMSTPAVMADGGVYIMYYMGGNFEETSLADYLENAPEPTKNAKIKGMKMRIGVAVSQDGISWGRVEGDDPTGACLSPYDKQDPNQRAPALMRGIDNDLVEIDEELYCGWPEVAVRQAPLSDKQGDIPSFFMFYSTMRKNDKSKCIAAAVSMDGFRWFKRGICLEPSENGMDAGGCARCNVLQKATYQDGMWKEEDGWVMFYEGVSKEDDKHRIMMAESTDGRSWKKCGVVFDVGTSNEAWDAGGVGSPHVLRLDDGSMRMYYTGQGNDDSTAIGVAKAEPGTDLTRWTREQAEFSFSL